MKTIFENLEFRLKRVAGSKSIKVTIKPGGEVLVTAPSWVPQYKVREFVESKKEWILGQKAKAVSRQTLPNLTMVERQNVKKFALRSFTLRLEELNLLYGFEYKKISIRDQSTRWGSCSKSGTLSFNYRLYFLSPELQDYVLVHELCHLKEMNHSKKFWQLVEKYVPNFMELRRELKKLQF